MHGDRERCCPARSDGEGLLDFLVSGLAEHEVVGSLEQSGNVARRNIFVGIVDKDGRSGGDGGQRKRSVVRPDARLRASRCGKADRHIDLLVIVNIDRFIIGVIPGKIDPERVALYFRFVMRQRSDTDPSTVEIYISVGRGGNNAEVPEP